MIGGDDDEPFTNDDRVLSAAQKITELSKTQTLEVTTSDDPTKLRRLTRLNHGPSHEDAVTAMLWRQLSAMDHGIYLGDLHSMKERSGKQIVTERLATAHH